MNALSRRAALRGSAAVAVAVAVPTVAVADDGKLFSEIAEFRKQWAEYTKVHTAAFKAWANADAERTAADTHAQFMALLKKHGGDSWDRMNELDKKLRRRSVRLFAMPAYTVEGVFAKTKLAHEMLNYSDQNDAANTWDIHYGKSPHCWTRQVLRDLERLAEGGP